jgi:hypothetical protein
MGWCRSRSSPEELGFAVEIGEIDRDRMPDGEPVHRLEDRAAAVHPRLRPRCSAICERKAMAMALVDRALRCRRAGRGDRRPGPGRGIRALSRDNVEATGFVQHLKLPHYVDFQAELELLRRLRHDWPKSEEQRGGRGMPPNDLHTSGSADRRPATTSPIWTRQTKRMIRRALLKAWPFPAIRCRSPAARCRCPMAGAPAAFR